MNNAYDSALPLFVVSNILISCFLGVLAVCILSECWLEVAAQATRNLEAIKERTGLLDKCLAWSEVVSKGQLGDILRGQNNKRKRIQIDPTR